MALFRFEQSETIHNEDKTKNRKNSNFHAQCVLLYTIQLWRFAFAFIYSCHAMNGSSFSRNAPAHKMENA